MKGKKDLGPQINEKIRVPQVQLITHEGDNRGTVSRGEALRLAEEAGLDLVVISDKGDGTAPIAKIMDFGKSLYEKKKKQAESKKHQKVIQVKEIKIRPKIGDHDYLTKMNQAVQFLKEGKRVKVTLFFRGRENATKNERGLEIFERVTQTLEDAGFGKNLVQESDAQAGQAWSRIYYLKTA